MFFPELLLYPKKSWSCFINADHKLPPQNNAAWHALVNKVFNHSNSLRLPDRLPRIQLGVDSSSLTGANGTSSVALQYFWALWSRKTKNPDVNTEPLARPLASLTHLLTLNCSLHACALLHSFICPLAHSVPSSVENELLMPESQAVLEHSDMVNTTTTTDIQT